MEDGIIEKIKRVSEDASNVLNEYKKNITEIIEKEGQNIISEAEKQSASIITNAKDSAARMVMEARMEVIKESQRYKKESREKIS